MEITIYNKYIIIKNPTDEIRSFLKEKLSYVDKKQQYSVRRMEKNPYWRNRPELADAKAKIRCSLYKEVAGGHVVIPGGFSYLFDEHDFIDKRVDTGKKISLPWIKKPFDLRDYQQETVDIINNKKRGILNLATGLGKSLIAIYACRAVGKRSLIVVPSDSIAKQFYAQLCSAFGANKVAMYGGGKKKLSDITVGIAASVVKNIDVFKNHELGLILGDECFPYRTDIATSAGPREIGWLVKQWENGLELPLIKSFNEVSKKFEYKKMTYGWRKEAADLLRIRYAKTAFSCTPNHKLLTSNGWKQASDLSIGDLLVGSVGDRSERQVLPNFNSDQFDFLIGSFLGDGCIHQVGVGRYRVAFTHGIDQRDYAEWKASLIGVKCTVIHNNGFSKKDAIVLKSRSFDLELPISSPKNSCPQWVIDALNPKSLAVWYMDDGCATPKKNGGKIATCSFDYDSNTRLCKKLQSMGIDCKVHFIAYTDQRAPGYYHIVISSMGMKALSEIISPYVHSSMSYKLIDPSLAGTYAWDTTISNIGTGKITSIEFVKNKTSGNRKPYVFDIEVEDNHNFVVCSHKNGDSGVVAHNCHHVAAETFYKIAIGLSDVGKMFGLTATAFRGDGKDILMTASCGDLLLVRDAKWGIANGWLAKPKFIVKEVQTSGRDYQDNKLMNYKAHVLNDLSMNRIIMEDAMSYLSQNKRVLVLVSEVEHGEYLSNRLGCPFAQGSDKQSQEYVDMLNNNKIRCLVGTSGRIGEGTDTQAVDVLIMANFAASLGPVTQAIGRGLRVVPDKTECLILDYKPLGSKMLSRHAENRIGFYKNITKDVTIIR